MAESSDILLVVIDMQNGFLGSRTRHIIPNVVRVVEEFQKRNLPIIFTRFHNEPDSPYERLIGWTRLRYSPEIDLTPELEPFANLIIDKNIYSAFIPEFEELLAGEGWTKIILCGVATDSCVLKTAADAFERGLIPIVVEDACSSHGGEDVHKAGLLLLGRFIGKPQIMNTETLLKWVDDQIPQSELSRPIE
jgi:nicotinamidase-related amidase